MSAPKYFLLVPLIVLVSCVNKTQKVTINPQDLDTCVELFELNEEGMNEYVKYSMGTASDTTKFYNQLCNCLHVDKFESGAVLEQGMIINCQPEGQWITYGDSNKIYNVTTFKAGKRDGEFLTYHSNGKLSLKCHYKDDKYDGEYKRYDPTGKLLEEKVFQDNRLISDKIYGDWQPDGVTYYKWPDEEGLTMTPGVYIWYNGNLEFLRSFEEEELKGTVQGKVTIRNANFDLTREASDKFFERENSIVSSVGLA